ncbi:VirB3 family type IV secretion system protein [Massilia sp. R2A-15]|uniref:VirB3 family type IV secretion system protein n=1 Tax=Massilia sp. R2A-15 TaxID=3064278 RepID=UPI00273693B9|nr:VirB3 family type IV secretion system protein [Massilia sp. R2A-15]WLI87826.1 VirB3 family type IV secretion system protein [Massilia sp. R2A-15]
MDSLDRSTIIRAGQRPAVIAYVPINVFIAECIAGLSLFWLFGVWAAAFLPVHLWFVIKTAEDYHWVAATRATVEHTMFAWTGLLPRAVRNKDLHGKGVVTFSASTHRLGERNYADLDQ